MQTATLGARSSPNASDQVPRAGNEAQHTHAHVWTIAHTQHMPGEAFCIREVLQCKVRVAGS